VAKRLKICLLCFLLFVPGISKANDNRIEISAGYFSFSGQNRSTGGKANVAGLAMYRLAYRRAVAQRADIGLGYSLGFNQVITGESIFGLELLARYFPFTAGNAIQSSGEGTSLTLVETYRPYVGAAFLQRNFKGIQTTYVGFGLSLGCEYQLDHARGLVGEVRYASLAASSTTSAQELVIALGMTFGF
jgi:hypothetical protein